MKNIILFNSLISDFKFIKTNNFLTHSNLPSYISKYNQFFSFQRLLSRSHISWPPSSSILSWKSLSWPRTKLWVSSWMQSASRLFSGSCTQPAQNVTSWVSKSYKAQNLLSAFTTMQFLYWTLIRSDTLCSTCGMTTCALLNITSFTFLRIVSWT